LQRLLLSSPLSQSHAPPAIEKTPSIDGVEGAVQVTLRINGKEHNLKLDPRTTLLDCLRENLNLPGTKKGATTANAAPVPYTSTAAV